MEKKELSVKELIDIARTCIAKGDCFNCTLYGEDSCTNALILVLADKLEELSDRWIETKKAKPAEDGEYLVMIAGAATPTVLQYDVDEEAFYGEDTELNPEYYPVTHWAMLPEFRNPSTNFARSAEVSRLSPFDKGGRVRRCATCRHEDRMAECDRCLECEKHSLWESR